MKYKLVQKGNPSDLAAPKKWYANSVNSGIVTQKSIAKEIAGRSSLTAGDVANVISNFLDLLPSHLIDGKSVQLGDFGTFRVSLSSEGAVSEDEFSTNKIKNAKILFSPSSDFKRKMDEINFEKE